MQVVSQLLQLAGRIFPDVYATMLVIKQLAYKYCLEAIRPYQQRGVR